MGRDDEKTMPTSSSLLYIILSVQGWFGLSTSRIKRLTRSGSMIVGSGDTDDINCQPVAMRVRKRTDTQATRNRAWHLLWVWSARMAKRLLHGPVHIMYRKMINVTC